jgi:hypothetical protein
LASDAYLAFSVAGSRVYIGDYTGGEAMPPTLWCTYYPRDSAFGATCSATPDTAYSISFEFHGVLRPGKFVLNMSPVRYFPDSAKGFTAGAKIERDFIDGVERWSTDSTHTGVLTITAVDSNSSRFNGSFSFTALDTSSTPRSTKIMHVDSGVIYRVPYEIYE